MEKLLTEKGAAVSIAEFMHSTGLLGQFQAADSQAMGAVEPENEAN